MRQQSAKIYSWALEKATSSKAPLWIALLFFLEIFLFIPLDMVLIFFCLQDRKKALLYAAIASIASTLSALGGYLIGHFLWDLAGPYIVPTLISTATFDRLSVHLQVYEQMAVFLTALIPFPLKALSLTAGVFHLGTTAFLSYFFLARIFRFSLIASSMILWGERVKAFVDKHFHKIFFAIGAKMGIAFLLFWALAR